MPEDTGPLCLLQLLAWTFLWKGAPESLLLGGAAPPLLGRQLFDAGLSRGPQGRVLRPPGFPDQRGFQGTPCSSSPIRLFPGTVAGPLGPSEFAPPIALSEPTFGPDVKDARVVSVHILDSRVRKPPAALSALLLVQGVSEDGGVTWTSAGHHRLVFSLWSALKKRLPDVDDKEPTLVLGNAGGQHAGSQCAS